MEEKLRECPFCGSQNVTNVLMPGLTWIIGCHECGCRTAEYTRSFDAMKSWNTRPDPEHKCGCGQCEQEQQEDTMSMPMMIDPKDVPF